MWSSNGSTNFFSFQIQCLDSKPNRGFGGNMTNKSNEVTTSGDNKGLALPQRRSISKQSRPLSTSAPRPSSGVDGKKISPLDVEFEERLKAVRRSALEQKQLEQEKEFGAIDYDSPTFSDNKTIGLGTKIGVGVAVLVFGLAFALGDFLPSGSVNPNEESSVVNKKLSEEEKANLQTRLKEYEAILHNSPKDPSALEGAAVTLAELGEYARAASLLDDLTKEKPSDGDVFRLLGEVKFELKDYEGSVAAYKSSAMVSKDIKFEVLQGLTNSLLAAKKPDEAVQFLLSCRDQLNSEKTSNKADRSSMDSEKLDPIQLTHAIVDRCFLWIHMGLGSMLVELLLGKAYSDWGHVSDAVAVYDQLISTNPNDFRGYLAKGIILKEHNNVGDAERMFIQARFFAPEKAKPLVDRYSRQ